MTDKHIEIMARAYAPDFFGDHSNATGHPDPVREQAEQAQNLIRGRTRDAIKALKAAGYRIAGPDEVVVPREPTFDMVSEGGSVIWENASEEKHQMIIRVYKAMLLAEGEDG